MKTRLTESNDVSILTIEGNIMQEYVSVFQSRLSDLIERGRMKIVIDMSEASYISSLCLAVIVEAQNRTSAAGGGIKIASANKLVTNLFEITNLNKKIPIFGTVDGAVAAFPAKKSA
jgi:anti-sigma B factor antagonist